MKYLILTLALTLTACNGGGASGGGSPESAASSDPASASTPAPSATPAPTASPTPSPTVVSYEGNTEGLDICQAFLIWDSATTTIEAQYAGYFYSFAGTGVTVTYSAGPDNGQTLQVLDPTTVDFGGDEESPDCVVQVTNAAVQSITQNVL